MLWKLETDRTRLREWTENDLDVLREHFCDAEVMKYVSATGKGFPETEIPVIFDYFKTHCEKHGFGPWAVVLKENEKKIIGVAGLKVGGLKHVPSLEHPDLGFSLFKPYWGRGLATELALALRDFGFQTLGFKKIGANTLPANTSSIKVLEKIGMTFEKRFLHRGVDTLLYTIESSYRGGKN